MASRLAVFVCITAFFSPSTSSLSSPSPFIVPAFLKDGVKGTWDTAPPNGLMAFFCAKETPIWMRDLLASAFAGRVVLPSRWLSALDDVKRNAPQGLLTLVVDLQCPNTEDIFRKASEVKIIRSPYRWLLLNISNEHPDESSCRDFAATLTAGSGVLPEAISTDADFVLACGGGSGDLVLTDLWGPLGPTTLGNWSSHAAERFNSDRKPPAVRRLSAGLNGYTFRTGFVITFNDTLLHLEDGANKQHDFMTKFNYEVLHLVARMLNGTMENVFTSDWGYRINGTWTGIIGLQVNRQVELAGTPLVIQYDRIPVQIFTNYQTPVRGIFIFREPPMSYEYNLFTQPFPTSLWVSIAGIVSLGAVMLYGTLRLEEVFGVEEHLTHSRGTTQVAEGRKRRLDASWSDVALLTVGAVCQQGSPVEARGVPGRIITLFLFLGILFLYTSYSASIVALLQSTSTNIETYEDFVKSRITLGAEDTPYTRYYMRNETEKIRVKVYQEKLIERGRRNPFMSLEDGMKRMRSSYFAFHSLRSSIYAVVSDTFQEHEKCGLREVVNFITAKDPQIALSRWSTHHEVVRIALRKIQERGIRHRQLQRYMTHKPICVNQGGNFQSVSLIDCFAAFVVLAFGIGVATTLMLLENLIFYQTRRLLRC